LPTPFTIRRLGNPYSPDLIQDLVRIFGEARREHLQFLIDLHDADEDARFFKDRLLPENEVWIAEVDRQPVGFIAFHGGWVNQLYVAPAFHRRGIGAALLSEAKRASPALQLWVFEVNQPAIDFYLGREFTIAERTDGAASEARMPDLRMVWTGQS
jgi:GNAT superfamily N-acetyltransferase